VYNSREEQLFSEKAEKGLCSHAYIVDGADGVGKLDFALYCASAMLCTGSKKPCGECIHCRKIKDGNHPDIFIIGREKTAAIAEIRELIRRASLKPNDSDKQIFIICNAGKLREDAQNALLKLFEEPPETVAMFLLAESRASLLPTVLSRGQRIHLDGMTDGELDIKLRENFPKASLREIDEAIAVSCGNYGEGERYLSNENSASRGKAEKLIVYALSRDSYELSLALLGTKYKREQLHSVLSEFIALVAEAQKQKFGVPHHAPQTGECAIMLKKASKRALAAMCEVAQLCMISLENNANVTLAASKLSLDLVIAAAR